MKFKEKVILTNILLLLFFIAFIVALFYGIRYYQTENISSWIELLFMLTYFFPLIFFLFGFSFLRKTILKKAKNSMKTDTYLKFALEIYKTPLLLSSLNEKHMLENEALKLLNFEEFKRFDQELDNKRKIPTISWLFFIFVTAYLFYRNIINILSRARGVKHIYFSFTDNHFLIFMIFICFIFLIFFIIDSFKLIYFDNKLNQYV
jgi:hypothetical protein